eukprot:scaffold13317_cov33-Tisochrysis_lutea.AAC.2
MGDIELAEVNERGEWCQGLQTVVRQEHIAKLRQLSQSGEVGYRTMCNIKRDKSHPYAVIRRCQLGKPSLHHGL